MCPITGHPDFASITVRYVADRICVELKSLKMYTLAYRNLGIFQENIVNRFLADVVKATNPMWAELVGDFTPRGGIGTKVTAQWKRGNKK